MHQPSTKPIDTLPRVAACRRRSGAWTAWRGLAALFVAGLFVAALVLTGCFEPLTRHCVTHDDCCPDGPAYQCVLGECEYDEHIDNDPVQYLERKRACEEAARN